MNRENQHRILSDIDLRECISSLDFSQNQLAVGLVDETVMIYNHTQQQELDQLFKFSGNPLGVVDVKYDQFGKLLAVSCLDSSIVVYNTEEGDKISQIQCEPMQNYKLSFDDRNVVTAGEMGKVAIYDIETQEIIQNFKTSDAFIQSIDISSDGKYLGMGNCLGHVFILDLQTKKIQKLECHGKQVRSVKFTQDNQKLITVSDDLHINIIDIEKNQLILTLTGHKSNINMVDTNIQNQNMFMTCSYDKTIKIWDLNTQQIVQDINCHSDNIWAAKFSKDGNNIASGSESGQLYIHSII